MTDACPAYIAAPIAVETAKTEKRLQFSVPSIRCATCIGAIERHLSGVAAVCDARVNATQKRVTVTSDLSEVQIVDELRSIGFEAYPLDQAALANQSDPVGRDLILRMGVAGFAMMNVMLLSVAVWSGATEATRDLFHLISAAIALPATIYSAQPFFIHAAKALRLRRLNMDVPISLAIGLTVAMSFYEAMHGGAHTYFDAALSLTFFLLVGRYLEHRTKSAARSAASELAALEVHKAERKVGDHVETVPVKSLCVGDRILVNSGVRVPVDGTLQSARAFTDRSFLTGESDPAEHIAGQSLCSGEINLGAPIEIIATAIGPDTRLSRIAALVETAENARNSYTSLADKAAQIYAPVVHILAAVSFLGWLAYDGDVRHALNVAIAVLIITCPCALGLAVPAVSTAAISRLYRMGFLVKSGTALERLATVTSMIFDKTGTLTKPGFSFDLAAFSDDQCAVAKGLASRSSHPLSTSLTAYLKDAQTVQIDGVVEHPGLGVEGIWNGERAALGRGDWLGAKGEEFGLLVNNTFVPLPNQQTILTSAESLSGDLNAIQISTEIVSGDTEVKTADVARKLGFARWRSMVTPEDKAEYILRSSQTQAVCMVGDGINDTAALGHARVSFAPDSALDATRSAADIVMLGDVLGKVPFVVKIARKAVALSKQNFGIAVVYNIVAVPVAIAGFATPLVAALAMSASSITVLANAMRIKV